MTDRVTVWRCIGCGRIEAPQPCIGVCQDRKVDLVYATEHEDALTRLAFARRHVNALEGLVRRFASTTPREGEWEHSYRALQDQARRVLAALAIDSAAFEGPASAEKERGMA